MTLAFWSAPLFSIRGCSEAAPNSYSGSKPAGPLPGPAGCRPFGLRLRKSCVPHVGSSKRRDHAPESGLSSGASSTRGQPRGKVVMFRSHLDKSRAVPGSNQSDEVGSSGTRVHRGIDVPNVAFLAAPLVVLVPGVPPFGVLAPRHGRHSSVTVRAWFVLLERSVISVCHLASVRAWPASQGTG